MPPAAPTFSNKPSIAPTAAPTGSMAPTSAPSLTPSINLASKPSRRWSGFSISFFAEWKLNTDQVLDFTSAFLKNQFQERLGLEVLAVELVSPTEDWESLDLTGKVIFPEGIDLPTIPVLDQLVLVALKSETYLRELSTHTNTKIDAIHVDIFSALGGAPFAEPVKSETDEPKEEDGDGMGMILIFAGVGAFLLSIFLLVGYYISSSHRRRNAAGINEFEDLRKTESHETKLTLQSGGIIGAELIQNNENDHHIPDNESDMTSLHTYNKGGDDSSINSHPSIFYNNHKKSALGLTGDDSSASWQGVEEGSANSNPVDG